MKISRNFISHDEGDEKILVSNGATKFSGIVHTNPTAGFIISGLKKDTTEDEIGAKMLKKWEVSEETARKDVRKIVGQLREIGAVDE